MLIANPQILSRILSECVSEYKDLSPDEIELQYLTEGSVRVSSAERIVFVHLGGDSGRSDITGLLWTLLGSHLEAEGRKKSLSEKFGIRLTEEIDEGVDAMCDISVGFYRNARRDGLAEGREEKTLEHIRSLMHKGNMSSEKAMELLSIPESERADLLDKLKEA